jgi:hypothetical protein
MTAKRQLEYLLFASLDVSVSTLSAASKFDQTSRKIEEKHARWPGP